MRGITVGLILSGYVGGCTASTNNTTPPTATSGDPSCLTAGQAVVTVHAGAVEDFAVAASGVYFVGEKSLMRVPLQGGQATSINILPARGSLAIYGTQLFSFANDGAIASSSVAGTGMVKIAKRPSDPPLRVGGGLVASWGELVDIGLGVSSSFSIPPSAVVYEVASASDGAYYSVTVAGVARIVHVSREGAVVATIVELETTPPSIAVDDDFIYYTVPGKLGFVRAHHDGSQRQTLGDRVVVHLALTEDSVYSVSHAANSQSASAPETWLVGDEISRYRKNDGVTTVLVNAQARPENLQVFGGNLYWSIPDRGSPLSSSAGVKVPAPGVGIMTMCR